MAYDRADWHHGGNYPKDLPSENGGTHIGMFLAWVIMNGFEGEELKEDNPAAVAALRARAMTGRQFLFRNCDGKLSDVDLNEEVNAFAKYYYSHPKFHYLEDYHNVLAEGLPSTYHVNDSWENYDKIAPVITQRFNEWKQRR
jgi:hypothetical protein